MPDGNFCCDDYIPFRTVGVQRDGSYEPGCGAGATVPGYRYPLTTFISIPAASSLAVVIRPRESGIVMAMLMENSGVDLSISSWTDSRGKEVGIEAASGSNGITQAWDPKQFSADILKTMYNPVPPSLGPITPQTGMTLTIANANTADAKFFSCITWMLRPKNPGALG